MQFINIIYASFFLSFCFYFFIFICLLVLCFFFFIFTFFEVAIISFVCRRTIFNYLLCLFIFVFYSVTFICPKICQQNFKVVFCNHLEKNRVRKRGLKRERYRESVRKKGLERGLQRDG